MKKKISIGIVVLLILGVAFYFKWNSDQVLVECHKNLKEAGMLASSCGFTLDEKTEVEIRVKAALSEGTVAITLQNEQGEILYTFTSDGKQNETVSLEAGSYDIRIDSDRCKGKFDVVVRK